MATPPDKPLQRSRLRGPPLTGVPGRRANCTWLDDRSPTSSGASSVEIHHHDVAGAFALSSAICCHLLSTQHHGVKDPWYSNKWFWAGLFGNIPATLAFSVHLLLIQGRSAADT